VYKPLSSLFGGFKTAFWGINHVIVFAEGLQCVKIGVQRETDTG